MPLFSLIPWMALPGGPMNSPNSWPISFPTHSAQLSQLFTLLHPTSNLRAQGRGDQGQESMERQACGRAGRTLRAMKKEQGGEAELPLLSVPPYAMPSSACSHGSYLLTCLKQTRSKSQTFPAMLRHSLLPLFPVQGSALGVSEKPWRCLVRLSMCLREMWLRSLKNETLESSFIVSILCQGL